jgi:hypothetical protein
MRQLGFAPVISPSPDPVSIAIDAISGIVALVSFFSSTHAQRQHEENEVVSVQNKFGDALATISAGADDPNATVDQLSGLADQLAQFGHNFYDYTYNFPIAGQGARETIFGDWVNGIGWVTSDAHPGWATKVFQKILQRIEDALGMHPQLGFDWTGLESFGIGIAGIITQAVTGRPPAVVPGPPGTYIPPGSTTMPTWVPWAFGGAILLLLGASVISGNRGR